MKILLASAAILALATALSAQDETTMTLEDVPATIMEAANAANTMGVTLDYVQMDNVDNVYEIGGKMADGMNLEIDVTQDGTIDEIEKQIEASALPAEVQSALDAELAGFEPTMVEESTRADGHVVYEFEGMHDGQDVDVEINADGTGYTLNGDLAG